MDKVVGYSRVIVHQCKRDSLWSRIQRRNGLEIQLHLLDVAGAISHQSCNNPLPLVFLIELIELRRGQTRENSEFQRISGICLIRCVNVHISPVIVVYQIGSNLACDPHRDRINRRLTEMWRKDLQQYTHETAQDIVSSVYAWDAKRGTSIKVMGRQILERVSKWRKMHLKSFFQLQKKKSSESIHLFCGQMPLACGNPKSAVRSQEALQSIKASK